MRVLLIGARREPHVTIGLLLEKNEGGVKLSEGIPTWWTECGEVHLLVQCTKQLTSTGDDSFFVNLKGGQGISAHRADE